MINISWNWDQADQSEQAFNEIKRRLITTCLPDRTCWRNYTGLPLGIGFGVLSFVSQISQIAEQLIKGLGNVLGSCLPCCDFSAAIGCDQLGLAVSNCIKLLIGLPIVGVFSIFVIPVMTYFSPDFTKKILLQSLETSPPVYEQGSFDDNDVLTEFGF